MQAVHAPQAVCFWVSTFHAAFTLHAFAAIGGPTGRNACNRPHVKTDLFQVNCAAWTARATLDTTTVDVWDRMMNTNVRGPFLLVQVRCSLTGDVYSRHQARSLGSI